MMADQPEVELQAETYFIGGEGYTSPVGVDLMPGIPSKAAINGHPFHPILVTMPVAFLTAALATDMAERLTSDPFWTRSSRWLIGVGLVTGGVASAVGLIDFLLIDRVRSVRAGWIHLIGNLLALSLSWQNLRIRFDKAKRVPKQGLLLSALVTFLLTITGWYGGQLIYKYKVAVAGRKA
jgi:uncharacterized membrane protein